MAEYVQLKKVADKYVTEVLAEFHRENEVAVTKEQRKEMYSKAGVGFSEGLTELNSLKLSPIEINGLSNFRNFFKEAIRACEAGATGNEKKAKRIMDKADGYAFKYLMIVRQIGASY